LYCLKVAIKAAIPDAENAVWDSTMEIIFSAAAIKSPLSQAEFPSRSLSASSNPTCVSHPKEEAKAMNGQVNISDLSLPAQQQNVAARIEQGYRSRWAN
jgi:hypothetical protein